jgi:peptide/nickel transport system substrate-binding protein
MRLRRCRCKQRITAGRFSKVVDPGNHPIMLCPDNNEASAAGSGPAEEPGRSTASQQVRRLVMQEPNYWQRISQKSLSRRKALQAGAAGFGAAALALAGCGGGGKEGTSTPGAGKTLAGGDSFLTPTGAEETPVYGGHAVSATSTIFAGLDLQLNVDWYYSAAFHGYLFDIDRRDESVHLQAADSHEQPDEVTHVFKLKQGIKFQNVDPMYGRELTADDVVYSFTRRRDEPKSQNDKQFLRDYTASFEATDKYTFRLASKAPYSPLMDEVGNASYAIIPKEAVEKWGDLQQHGVGFGAYIMQDFVRGERYSYVKNPDFYMKGLPYIDSGEVLVIPDDSTITAAFETSQTDGYGGSQPNRPKVDKWKNIKGMNVRTGNNYWHRTYMLKVDQPPFNDIRVRQAIDLCIDRQDIIDKMAFGYGKIAGPVVPDLTRYALPQEELREFYKVDVAQAKQLLSAAGYGDGLDVELKVENVADLSKLSQIVSQHLSKAGINLRLVLQELGMFLAQTMYARNFEMMCYYNLPYEEPDRPMCQWFSKGQAGFSFSGYNNPTADDWINKERAELDPEKRAQIIKDAQRFFITEHGPQIGTETDVGYGASWDWLHGVDDNINRGTYLLLGVHNWLTEKRV